MKNEKARHTTLILWGDTTILGTTVYTNIALLVVSIPSSMLCLVAIKLPNQTSQTNALQTKLEISKIFFKFSLDLRN